MGKRLAALAALALLGATMITACTDWSETFATRCRETAAINIHDAVAWDEYVAQLATERLAAGDSISPLTLWSTKDFVLTSSWSENGGPIPAYDEIRSDDYHLRKDGRLVATIRNLSLRTRGVDAAKSWSCIYDHPQFYIKIR